MRQLGASLGIAVIMLALACSSTSTNSSNGGQGGASGGGGNAGGGSAGVGSGFCDGLTPAPKLCADFDSQTSTFGNVVKDQGTFAIDDAQAFSKPGSLLTQTLTGPNPIFFAYGRHTQPVSTKHFVAEAQIRIVKKGLQPAGLFGITLLSPDIDNGVRLDIDASGTKIEDIIVAPDGGKPTYHPYNLIKPLPVDEWAHVRIELDAAAPLVKVQLNGDEVLSQPLDPSWMSVAPSSIWLEAGILFSTEPDWEVRFDNVVLELN